MSAGKAPENIADTANISGVVSAGVVSGVAGRYAVALFELARDAGALEAVEADFALLDDLIAQSPEVRTAIASPLLSRDERGKALDALVAAVKSTGDDFNDLTVKFLGVAAQNGRAAALQDMIAAYRALLAHERGEITAEVVSAKPLTDDQVEALRARLKDVIQRDVKLDARVDAGILGGLVVKIGSRMIDSSLRTKLSNLKVAMKEVG